MIETNDLNEFSGFNCEKLSNTQENILINTNSIK